METTTPWSVVVVLVLYILYRELVVPRWTRTRKQRQHRCCRRPIRVAARRDAAQGTVTAIASPKIARSSQVRLRLKSDDVDIRQIQNNAEERMGEEPDKEKEEETDLLLAVLEGDAAAVRELLKAKYVDVNARAGTGTYERWTPLLIAAVNDHVEIVRQLLDCGAATNATTPKGDKTALHLASELGVVDMLLEKSAAVDARDHRGNTPLHLAVRNELEGKVSKLLEHGANVDSKNANEQKPIHVLLEKINEARRAAVSIAAFQEIAQSLVRHGSKWDDACDNLISKDKIVSLAFRVAILRWIDEHYYGAEALTDIPEAVLRQGPSFVSKYLDARGAPGKVHPQRDAHSKANATAPVLECEFVLRRQVFVVGPNLSGKTSLVESLAGGNPSLEHPDPPIIGIDKVPMVFSDRVLSSEGLFLEACRAGNVHAVRWLVATKRVRVNVPDSRGMTPIHKVLREVVAHNTTTMERGRLQALQAATQVLISYGAKWDDACDRIVEDKDDASRAFRETVLIWREEHKQGSRLTMFPDEAYRRGPSGIHAYVAETDIHRAQAQQPVVTDAAASVSSQPTTSSTLTMPAADQQDVAKNDWSIEKINAFRQHDVTFFDCAGHEAYQVAHSAFFSRRALFLICVNLHAYAVALEQTELRANKERDVDRLMDEFVDCKILRWIRLILTCQPDAEFVFVGTKADVLMRTKHRIVNAHEDLKRRLARYAGIIGSKSKLCDTGEHLGLLHLRSASSTPQTMAKLPFQALSATAKRLRNFDWLTVSCKDKKSIRAARKAIEQVIVKSKRSFRMPELYSKVVDVISNRGVELAARQPSHQVAEAFLKIPVVSLILRTEIPKHRSSLSNDSCRAIMRTLHDIGDVLWYEDIGIDYLKNRVMLRPLLLVEFVRQIARHNFHTEVMPHAALKEQPFWDDLDPVRTLVMKQLLQKFHLVLPVGSNMEWNSDLMVPAFWRSKESALWLFLGDLLTNEPSLRDMKKNFIVQWEYHFTTPLPDTLFDQLVIESYTSHHKRQAGPDWIMYTVEDEFACRVVVTRAPRTLERVLRVEAVASESAGPTRWVRFERLCEALERVLSRYKGLVVSRFVDDEGTPKKLDTLVDQWMQLLPHQRESKRWLPPSLDWYYNNVMKGRVDAHAAAIA